MIITNKGVVRLTDAEKKFLCLWLSYKWRTLNNVNELLEVSRQHSTRPISDELLSYKIHNREVIAEWVKGLLLSLGMDEMEIESYATLYGNDF